MGASDKCENTNETKPQHKKVYNSWECGNSIYHICNTNGIAQQVCVQTSHYDPTCVSALKHTQTQASWVKGADKR